jgi:hypothetical protein
MTRDDMGSTSDSSDGVCQTGTDRAKIAPMEFQVEVRHVRRGTPRVVTMRVGQAIVAVVKIPILVGLLMAGCSGVPSGLPDQGVSDLSVSDLAIVQEDMTSAPDLQQPDLVSKPPDLWQQPADMVTPADLVAPADMTPAVVQPGGNCTASSQCYCYAGCSSGPIQYGYCMTDYNYANESQGSYCVAAYWVASNQGAYNGYWSMNSGVALPGYTSAMCSHVASTTGADPKIPIGPHICPNVNTLHYLVALP